MKPRVWTRTQGDGYLWVRVISPEEVLLYYITNRRHWRSPKRIQVRRLPVAKARAYWRVHATGQPGEVDTFPLEIVKRSLWMKPKATTKPLEDYPKANIIPGHQPLFRGAASLGQEYDLPHDLDEVLQAHESADEDWFHDFESYRWLNRKRTEKLPSAPVHASVAA